MERPTSFGRLSLPAALGLLCQALLLSQGCAGGAASPTRQPAPQATVYYEEVADWSFEAAHPAVIDEAAIKKTLGGLHVSEGSISTTSSADGSKPMRVFSDEDVEHLAPLLARALSQAQPEYVVAFRLSSSAGSGSEPTAGSIYVLEGAIHLTISKGAVATTFMPEAAARAEQAPPYAAAGKTGVTAHVIDYLALAKAPMPAALPVPKTAIAQPAGVRTPALAAAATIQAEGAVETQVQLSRAKDMLAKKDTEISVLRKESEWMKRELRDRDEEIKALKATVKTTPKKRKAEAYPTR